MEDEEGPEPKISLPEVILIGAVLALIDLIEVAIVFFGLDDFWILDAVASMIFLYLFIKGVPPMRQLLCWVVELVPWLGALPLLTVGWGLTVWVDHHPSSAVAKGVKVAALAGGGSKGPPKTLRGAGARSYAQIERAETQAMEKLGRREEKAGVAGAIAGNGGGTEAKPAAKEPRKPFSEEPTPFEKLQRLAEEPLPEEESEEEEYA